MEIVPRGLASRLGQRACARVNRVLAESLFDAQQLVVLRQPIRAAERAGLDLPAVGRHGTIRKSVKRLQNIEKQETDGTFEKITKKERLFLTRERDKLKKILEGVETMGKLPGVVFVVDIKKEDIASVKEAKRLNIPVFAIVDTNRDPEDINYMIPANDDAVKTIELIVKHMADAVIEGQAKFKERRAEVIAERERARKEHHEETEQAEEKKVSKKHLKRRDKKEEDISEEKNEAEQKDTSSEN